MFNFFSTFFFVFISLEFLPFFDFFIDYNIHLNNIFIWYFLFFFYLNYSFNDEVGEKLNIDLIYKYLYFLIKTPNFLLNYFINTIKKIYLYLVHFKYRLIYTTLFIFFKKYFSYLFLWWKPLFKKSSYFGYYRSNRSKWIK